MKTNRPFLMVMLLTVFVVSAAQASGIQQNGMQASQHNPWRAQPQQWGYQNRSQPTMRQSSGVMPQPLYSAPPSRVPARQIEYRRYIQQMGPYYSNQMPWWSDQNAVPYGPWSLGR